MTPTAIFAYGYEIEADVDEARTLLLSAAHAEGRMHQASAEGLVDDPDQRDPEYQLALIGLYAQQWGDGHGDRVILASQLDTAESDLVILNFDEPTDEDRERVNWAMKTLGIPAFEEPQWLLGVYTLG